ncbi:hypothetical protein Tco_0324028 [Tanacetum coccineum]
MAKAASASTTERKFMLLQLTILSHSSNSLCDNCPSSCTHFKIFYVCYRNHDSWELLRWNVIDVATFMVSATVACFCVFQLIGDSP